MVDRERWITAQAYERGFWAKAANRIASNQNEGLNWYTWKADRFKSLLRKAVVGDGAELQDKRVLEVGSGPVGIISYIGARERAAVDPLCAYYSQIPELVRNRDPKVRYLTVEGESLPFPSGSFDVVIMDNVIDHVQNAHQVMREIDRVLDSRGMLYFTVNLHPRSGAVLHRIASALKIDRGHPHTFTLQKARRFLASHGFRVEYDEWDDYFECWRKDLGSPVLKDKLKAIFQLSEFLYTAVAQKK